MLEINLDTLDDIHIKLTAAGIAEYTSIASDATRLEARIDVARDTILTLTRERDALRARLAERPCPSDHRDPPVSTAAEEAIERLWGTLYALGGDLDRADFADGIEGIADAVEAALSLNLEQIHTLTEERDHAGRLAMEQFRCRLYRT